MMVILNTSVCLSTISNLIILSAVFLALYPLLCNGEIAMTTLMMIGSGNLTKGVKAKITCNTQGDPNPLIDWSLGDATIFEGIHVMIAPMLDGNQNVTNTVEFKPGCEHHNKLLTCTAIQDLDGVAALNKSVLLRVSDNTGSESECEAEQLSNNVRISPSAVNVTLGDPVTVSCLYDININVTYQWFFNSDVVGTSSVLQIQSVLSSNDGLYTCMVTHSGGSNSATVDINVQYAPFLSTNLVNIKATNGEKVNLTCHNDANPPATFFIWTHDNTLFNLQNSSFSLDMGTSNFTVYCKAGNTIGLSGTTIFNITLTQAITGTNTDGTSISLALESSLGGIEIAAISMGSLIFLVLLILLLLFCCCYGTGLTCRTHKDKHKTHPLGTTEKDIIYVIKIPRFYENPAWTTSSERKSYYSVLPLDEIRSGPIISLYDDQKEQPDGYYLNSDKHMSLNKDSTTKC